LNQHLSKNVTRTKIKIPFVPRSFTPFNRVVFRPTDEPYTNQLHGADIYGSWRFEELFVFIKKVSGLTL